MYSTPGVVARAWACASTRRRTSTTSRAWRTSCTTNGRVTRPDARSRVASLLVETGGEAVGRRHDLTQPRHHLERFGRQRLSGRIRPGHELLELTQLRGEPLATRGGRARRVWHLVRTHRATVGVPLHRPPDANAMGRCTPAASMHIIARSPYGSMSASPRAMSAPGFHS